jgi:hypothetical protein
MASAVTTQKLGARNAIEALAHVPASASATVVTPDSGTTKYWRDMRDFEWFFFAAANHTLTGNGITLLEIVAATDNAGTGIVVIASSGTLSGTGVGNGGCLEIQAAQLREVGGSTALRYVAGRITVANSSDKCAVTYVRGYAKAVQQNLSPATF